MQVAGYNRLVGVITGIVLLSILAVSLAPELPVLPAHSRLKRAARHDIGPGPLPAAAAIALPSVNQPCSPVYEPQPLAPAMPIYSLLCVRIC